jgi:hypothetical protein
MPRALTRPTVSLLSVAAGVGAYLALSPLVPADDTRVYLGVGTAVVTGWLLRTVWTRELRGQAVWRGLLAAIVAGVVLAAAYRWLVLRPHRLAPDRPAGTVTQRT